MDDQLISIVPLPQLGCFHGIALAREIDETPFAERERRLLALFHRELASLWTTPPLVPDGPRDPPDPRDALPPRLREVLDRVSRGQSERQVALAMGLSQHTVHSYLKVLHRRFGATSRAELIERTRPRKPAALRPRLEESSS